MEQYNVTGMSCAACSTRVEKAVSKVPGVTSCSVSLLTNSMGIEGTASPESIIKAYQTQVMEGVYGKAVEVNEVKRVAGSQAGQDKLYIDFKAADVESLGLGSGSEGNYFGDLAQSITANIPEITEIYYTMDGGDFVTGHLWFSKDEPFWYEHEEPAEE